MEELKKVRRAFNQTVEEWITNKYGYDFIKKLIAFIHEHKLDGELQTIAYEGLITNSIRTLIASEKEFDHNSTVIPTTTIDSLNLVIKEEGRQYNLTITCKNKIPFQSNVCIEAVVQHPPIVNVFFDLQTAVVSTVIKHMETIRNNKIKNDFEYGEKVDTALNMISELDTGKTNQPTKTILEKFKDLFRK